jgi:hypothetical protein
MTESTYELNLNMRPDPPAGQRGVVLVTADLMGDPTPEYRLRKAEAELLVEVYAAHERAYHQAYAKGYRARKG